MPWHAQKWWQNVHEKSGNPTGHGMGAWCPEMHI